LNSSLCIIAISGLLDGEYCSQTTGTKPGQVQKWPRKFYECTPLEMGG
jgi:hypothetical protein